MFSVKQPLCIVCGLSDTTGPLSEGVFKDFHFWFHKDKCKEILDRVRELAFGVWFGNTDRLLDFADAVLIRANYAPRSVVLFGAGISIPSGIPGYKSLLKMLSDETGKEVTPQTLFDSIYGDKQLVNLVARTFAQYARTKKPGYAHLSAVEFMLDGNFSVVVNMNWDMLLEETFERVVSIAKFRLALRAKVERATLNLVVTDSDLKSAIKNTVWNRSSIFKIHGSPLLYFCPKCSGLERFRAFDVVLESDVTCPFHSDQVLNSHIVFTGNRIDEAASNLLQFLVHEFQKAENIILIGYSGRDKYIYNSLIEPNKDRVWTVAPHTHAYNTPSWKVTPKKQRIDSSAIAFFRMWNLFLWSYPAPFNIATRFDDTLRILYNLDEIDLSNESAVTKFYHNY